MSQIIASLALALNGALAMVDPSATVSTDEPAFKEMLTGLRLQLLMVQAQLRAGHGELSYMVRKSLIDLVAATMTLLQVRLVLIDAPSQTATTNRALRTPLVGAKYHVLSVTIRLAGMDQPSLTTVAERAGRLAKHHRNEPAATV
jgi:hypothetical protein